MIVLLLLKRGRDYYLSTQVLPFFHIYIYIFYKKILKLCTVQKRSLAT
jgi:hypothetical protein